MALIAAPERPKGWVKLNIWVKYGKIILEMMVSILF